MADKDVQKCLELLDSASLDNERFAALLMVTKVIKAESCDAESRRLIFNAVGFKFLKRLLKSKDPEGCPSGTYQSLALTILSCFCSDDTLVVHPEMLSCLPLFNNILTNSTKKPEVVGGSGDGGDAVEMDQNGAGDNSIPSDCFDCLTCIAAHHEGRAAMVTHHTVSTLCHVTVQSETHQQRSLDLLHHLAQTEGHAIWWGNDAGLCAVLSHYAAVIKTEQSEKTFEACDTLHAILSSVTQDQVTNLPSTWRDDVRTGISMMLRSKIGPEHRNRGLQLASLIINLVDIPWILGEDRQDSKCLLLVVHLVCIEVRMTLENKPFTEVLECGTLLSSCYMLLENVISFLTCGPALGLDDRQVTQLHSAMVGAFNAITYFLSEVHQEHMQQVLSPVVLASIRALGSWIAEETTALKDEIIKLVPFLVNASRMTCNMVEDLRTEEAFSQLSVTDSETDSASTSNSKPAPPIDVLCFLLPGLCHLTAEDQSRKVLIEEEAPSLLARYFSSKWDEFEKTNGGREPEVALTTMCGIFLNLVVLEKDAIATSQAFQELLQALTQKLPALDCVSQHVVLGYNISVLGLMLLQYQTEEQGTLSEAHLNNFITACISLFRSTHTSQQRAGEGGLHLVLADGILQYWEDVQELWFLGMQALCSLIPRFTCICSTIGKSGWIQSATKLLIDVKGRNVEKGVSVSYQTLFCEVAQADPAMRQVIQDKKGAQLIKLYGFEDLGKLLDS